MLFKAVLFDLDGTLLDTLEDIADSMNQVLSEAGFSGHPTDSYRYFVGDGVDVLVRRALPAERQGDDALVRELTARQRIVYGSRWDIKTRPYAGAVELLQALKARGIRRGVLSNKPDATTVDVVKRYFDGLVEAARGQRDEIPRKPHPAGALEMARGWDLDPAEVLYLGDTGVDMETAVGAGMHPAGALWGFRTRQELIESGAKELVENPLDLLAILDRGLPKYSGHATF